MMPVARHGHWTDQHPVDDARSGSPMGYQRHLSLVEPERGVAVEEGDVPDAPADV